MGEDPEAKVAIRAFTGMVSNADDHDLQPGESTVQVNVTSALRAGELNLRRGLRELVFDPE